MSKAFVIKNKEEDRYLYTFYIYEDENFAFGELNEAKLFDNLDNANDYKEKICWVNSNLKFEVVPVTIAEGDLEEENRVLKRALEIANEQFNSINYQYFDESNIDFKNEWIEQAKGEKDETHND